MDSPYVLPDETPTEQQSQLNKIKVELLPSKQGNYTFFAGGRTRPKMGPIIVTNLPIDIPFTISLFQVGCTNPIPLCLSKSRGVESTTELLYIGEIQTMEISFYVSNTQIVEIVIPLTN